MLRGVDKYLTEDELMRQYAQEGNQLTKQLFFCHPEETTK